MSDENRSNGTNKEKRTLRILYFLAVYILFQLIWWGYHLIQLNREIFQLKALLNGSSFHPASVPKVWMVVGEGSVFFLLLAAGFWYMRRTLNRELELAAMEQNFLLAVTHELKTPIASVKLILETLQTRTLDQQKTALMMQQAIQETRRLEQLTENILLATRLDQRTIQPYRTPFDFSALISREVQRFVLIHQANMIAEVDDHIMYNGDSQMITAMVVNLIGNALKYAGHERQIIVRLKTIDGHVLFMVEDFGGGVPDNIKPKIFDKFFRAGNEQTRTTKGTGLGLYIARTIARLHGGDISVRDNQPTGSIFAVSLPN